MARIYSIQYSESENKGKAVADSNHYCTSEAINKFHGISSFGDVRGFDMIEPSDISNANFHKNPERPAAILVGTSQESITSLSKNSCKNFSPPISDEIIKLLSKINNELIFSLFDIFWPFTTTNRTLRNLKIKLEGADLQAHIPAKKTYNIMFDGSNARPVFFKHHDRLKEIYKENPNNDYIKNQLENNKSIINYLTTTEEDLQNEKCCNLFKIDYEYFFKNSDDKHNEKKIITKKAQSIFNTVSTQAFQIGYLMSILTIVEKLIDTESDTHVKYEKRLNYVNISTKLIISCLNNFFTPDINGKTKSLSILNKSKFNIFNTEELGLRSFHRLFVDELNEKQWVFFRYTIYEIIFSKHNIQFLIDHINEIDDESIKLNLKDILISLIDEIDLLRDDFIENACSAQLNKQDFKTYLNTESGRLEGANKDVKEIQTHLYDLKEKKKLETAKICNSNIKKSLGSVNTFENAKNELLTKI